MASALPSLEIFKAALGRATPEDFICIKDDIQVPRVLLLKSTTNPAAFL
jgi:hypothetical protein